MKPRHFIVAILAFSLFWIYSACAQQSAEQLYQAAIYKEEVQGELDQAIKIFEKIASEYPGSRSVVAKALLRSGLCYEKLGRQEAQKAYQRILREYADQQDVAAEARTRLDALEQAVSLARPKGMLLRKVQIDTTVYHEGDGAVSSDGRYFVYTDWVTGDLAVYDQDSGKKRRLTDKGPWEKSSEFAQLSRWSSDGKQVVYNWYKEQGTWDLRVTALDVSKPRIIYSSEDEEYVEPIAWFPDGRQILALFTRKDSTRQIVTVSCADGSIGVLKTLFKTLIDPHVSLSPDGRYIVYDSPPKEASSEALSNHDIFLLAVDGKSEIPLVEHPAHDFVLGWAPDGRRVLFASDRSGTLDAFLIKITDDGKPQGAPELVKTNIGPVVPMGFTRKGSFYYGYREGHYDIFTTELDPQTGKILVPAKKAIERHEGYNTFSEYSPDGKYLAYVSKRGLACLDYVNLHFGNVLCIRSLETGKDREIFPEGLKRFGMPCWSPDSRFIFVVKWDAPYNNRGIYRIDAQTGEVTQVVILEQEIPPRPKYSRDGKAIYMVRKDRTKDYCQIVVRDLESGIEKEIYRAPSDEKIWELSRSPDGQWLCFISVKNGMFLKVIPVAGGEPRELCKGYLVNPIWSADGRYILFTGPSEIEENGNPHEWDLCRISVAGGKPQRLGLGVATRSPSAHPDGRRISFTSATPSTYSGIWVMENFLP